MFVEHPTLFACSRCLPRPDRSPHPLRDAQSKNTGRWQYTHLRATDTLKGHIDAVGALLTFNGYLASGSEDNTVRLWRIDTGQPVACLRGHKGLVLALAHSGGSSAAAAADQGQRSGQGQGQGQGGPLLYSASFDKTVTWRERVCWKVRECA